MNFEISQNFKTIECQKFCDRVADGTHSSPKKTVVGKRLVTSKNVKSGRLDLSSSYMISVEDFDSINKRSKVDQWDLLLTMIGTVGEVCLVTEPAPDFAIKNVGLLKCGDELRAKWLYYFLRSPQGKKLIEERKTGSTQQYVSLTQLRKLPISYPTNKKVMHEINQILGCIDDQITLLHETNSTLEAIAQILFKSWFVDFDPVRAKQEGKKPEGMDEATAALFPDSFEQSDSGEIPKGWESKLLGSLVVPKRGKIITRATIIDGNIPVVAGGIDPAYFHNQSNVSSPVVTISSSGNAGFVRLYQQDIWASDCSYISKEQSILVFYWYLLLKSNQEKIYLMRHGAVQQHVSPSDLMRLNVFFPNSLEIVSIFNEIVSQLFKKIELGEAQIKTLTSLRDSLLPRLISGQLLIADAEAEIEKVSV